MATNWMPPKDLISCEEEPIHIIGQIQPHAYLLGINTTNSTIVYESENFKDLLKETDSVLGKTIEELDALLKSEVNEKVLEKLISLSDAKNDFNSKNSIRLRVGDKGFDAIVSNAKNMLIVELEPAEPHDALLNTENILGDVLMQLNDFEKSNEQIMQTVADQIKDLIGYDRVMIYKFWEDFHGEVIAESKNASMESFLGLHFPATDIPAQARELYVKNKTRIIADIHAENVPIHSISNKPLDLTYSKSRAVSPIHIEYLQNMGVGASYSISIVLQGKLWGLIACHHASAKYISIKKRKATEIISEYLSNLIQFRFNKLSEEANTRLMESVDRIDLQMRKEREVLGTLKLHSAELMELGGANGWAILLENEVETYGQTPPLSFILQLSDWCSQQKKNESVWYTNSLSNHIPEAIHQVDTASGVLMATISSDSKEQMIWFKPEQLKAVVWAGKDEKTLVKTEEGQHRLSPRKSFEKWSEEIRYTSADWNNSNIKAVSNLREKIVTIIQQKSSDIKRLNEKLTIAYKELDSFSYTLSHDMKTPLNTITGYLELLEDEVGDSGKFFLNKIHTNTAILLDMIKNVLAYARLGREEMVKEPVKLRPIIDEIKDQMRSSRKFTNFIDELEDDIEVYGHKTMVYQVFLNLIENGVKYRDSRKDGFVKMTSKNHSEGYQHFQIIDNGLGIEQNLIENVFGLFKRGNISHQIEGSGVGLAIVKKIVDHHEGKIWLESEVGKGSTFHLLLKVK